MPNGAHPRLSNLSLSKERSMPTGGGSGRGATRAVSTMLNCLFAVTWNSVPWPRRWTPRLDESASELCQAFYLSRRHRSSSGFRRPLLGQGEVRIREVFRIPIERVLSASISLAPALSNLSLSEERSMLTGGGSGRGATRAISTMLNCLCAVTWNIGGVASALDSAVRRVGVGALSGIAPLPATPLFERLSPTSPRTRRGQDPRSFPNSN